MQQVECDRITFSLLHSMNISLNNLKEELHRSKSDIIKQAIEHFIHQEETKKLKAAVDLMSKEYENNDELTYLTALDSVGFQ